MPPKILILSATDFEQQALRQALQNAVRQIFAHRNRMCGDLGGRSVVLLETGIGAVNTAQALTATLQVSLPDLVLQVGVGGAYLSSELDVGDLALATEENYGDFGVLAPGGWQPGDAIGIPVFSKERDYFNRFPLDPLLTAQARNLVRNTHREEAPSALCAGPFVTVQQCSGTTVRGNELAARFGGICENMEGAAAAHVCALYDVPFLEVRGISNRVEDRNRDAWDLPLAARRAQEAARTLVEYLELSH